MQTMMAGLVSSCYGTRLIVQIANASYLDPYCDPCHDFAYGSNSCTLESSLCSCFSLTSFETQEQVSTDSKKTTTMSSRTNPKPKAKQSQNTQLDVIELSEQTGATPTDAYRQVTHTIQCVSKRT